MIIVKNTKELEEKYDLNLIPDDEQIRVIGGMEGKPKYNSEIYQRRTTYSARQLKQIIQQMKYIEDRIPENWNQWQRAKYIYELLASNIEYNYDIESYSNEQSSNLTILMSRKGICAGYSLTFKEMMDRQGIECDYIRGRVDENGELKERHAWNVLSIDGRQIPVDLTWDSERIRSGQGLGYFGNDKYFLQEHKKDMDEKDVHYYVLSNKFVDLINTDEIKIKEELKGDEKLNALNFAIEQTYKKLTNEYGEHSARIQVIEAIKKYIKEGEIKCFTRQGGARDSIEKYFEKEDMIDLLVKQYAGRCAMEQDKEHDILGNSLRQNMVTYDDYQAEVALKEYILSGNTKYFTRENNARQNIEQYITRKFSIRNNYI